MCSGPWAVNCAILVLPDVFDCECLPVAINDVDSARQGRLLMKL